MFICFVVVDANDDENEYNFYLVAPVPAANSAGGSPASCDVVCCPGDARGCSVVFFPHCAPHPSPVQISISAGQSAYICIVLNGTSQYEYEFITGLQGTC
jgi:hypothetical protein